MHRAGLLPGTRAQTRGYGEQSRRRLRGAARHGRVQRVRRIRRHLRRVYS